MTSTESEPHSTIVIDDDMDAETDTPQFLPQELQRKRHLIDYSLSEYEALFDGSALLNASAFTTSQPLKKHKILNLKAVLVRYFSQLDLLFADVRIGNSKSRNSHCIWSRVDEDQRPTRRSAASEEVEHWARNQASCRADWEKQEDSQAWSWGQWAGALMSMFNMLYHPFRVENPPVQTQVLLRVSLF